MRFIIDLSKPSICMEFVAFLLLNGISYGLLLFMLSAGLVLIFGMMGVFHFAHASFYMLGAYFAYTITPWLGFWAALVLSPLGVGVLGAFIERYGLRQLGHRAELLITFGVSVIVLELVQLVWGRSSVDYRIPVALEGNLFTLHGFQFPLYRGFMMGVSLFMLAGLWWVMARTRVGLVIQAALTHTQMAEALGHNVPQVLTFVFGGGCALAGLAGVMAGNAFVTEPGMAASMGGMIFVVMVVGGMGSLGGAFVASLLIGVMQTLVAAMDMSLLSALPWLHFDKHCDALCHIQFSQLAPVLPYLLMVLVLMFRPHGMGGKRG